MNTIFYIAAAAAFVSSVMAITNRNAIHALLYLIISLLSVSVIFYILGAPLAAALEVIVYAGAIMVLFIFVVMMLNIGMEEETEKRWLTPKMWIVPFVLAAILLAIYIYVLRAFHFENTSAEIIGPKQVGRNTLYNLSYCRGTGCDTIACRYCRCISPGKTEEKGISPVSCINHPRKIKCYDIK